MKQMYSMPSPVQLSSVGWRRGRFPGHFSYRVLLKLKKANPNWTKTNIKYPETHIPIQLIWVKYQLQKTAFLGIIIPSLHALLDQKLVTKETGLFRLRKKPLIRNLTSVMCYLCQIWDFFKYSMLSGNTYLERNIYQTKPI